MARRRTLPWMWNMDNQKHLLYVCLMMKISKNLHLFVFIGKINQSKGYEINGFLWKNKEKRMMVQNILVVFFVVRPNRNEAII